MENKDQENKEQVVSEVEDKPVVDAKQTQIDSLARTLRKTKAELESLKKTVTAPLSTDDEVAEGDVNVQLKKYRAEVNKLARSLDDERKQAAAEKDKSTVLSSLSELGVVNTKVLYNHLTTEGMITKDESGSFLFRVGKNEVELPLELGLKQYLSSGEGKMFLPPTGAAGSGAKPSGNNKQVFTESKADRKASAMSALVSLMTKKQ